MIVCSSLLILPRHFKKVGITIFDNLQSQEIMKLNNKDFNTIYNIKDLIRSEGFVFEAEGHHGESRWYLKTQDNTYKVIMKYHEKFSTAYYLNDLEHYRICPTCMAAIPETWKKCERCGSFK